MEEVAEFETFADWDSLNGWTKVGAEAAVRLLAVEAQEIFYLSIQDLRCSVMTQGQGVGAGSSDERAAHVLRLAEA